MMSNPKLLLTKTEFQLMRVTQKLILVNNKNKFICLTGSSGHSVDGS